VERAALLGLSVPETTALVGGLRVLDVEQGHDA
jgi:catalase (peroxidase I)